MTGDRSKTRQALRERYLVEYRSICRKSDRIAFFEAISETAAAANVLFWRSFANAMSAWLRQDLGAALAFSEDAIALEPECAFAWNGKGAAFQAQGRYEEAAAAYEKATVLMRSPKRSLLIVGGRLSGAPTIVERLDAATHRRVYNGFGSDR
jgi:tetratricopeptide (TPR) repeat protein